MKHLSEQVTSVKEYSEFGESLASKDSEKSCNLQSTCTGAKLKIFKMSLSMSPFFLGKFTDYF